LSDVWQHYRRTHTTSNMRFVIAGKLSATRQKSLVNSFNKILMPEGVGRFDIPTEVPRKLEAPLYINNDTVKNLYFYIDTFILRQINNSEMDALNLLNIIDDRDNVLKNLRGCQRKRPGLSYVFRLWSGQGQC
jgi:hypothetical protein